MPMVMRMLMVICVCLGLSQGAMAEDRVVRLFAAPDLVASGLMKHIVPRFSLKTQVKVELVDTLDAADVALADTGRALFHGLDRTWSMDVRNAGHPGTDKFSSWLTSDVGARTIQGFAPEGTALFGPPAAVEEVAVAIEIDGDAEFGHKVSRSKCTRCHAVDKDTAWSSIGSTPSFSVLRSLDDWQDRFALFYVLNPHPAFTQITDLTEPFPIDRPSPISPIELSIEEVEAIMAYVAAMAGADLGSPLQHQ